MHPGTGHITQPIRRSSTTIVRDILGQHLHIGSGKPEQLDLFRSRCSIRIADVYRRIGNKTFTEIATCRTAELVAGNDLFVHHTAAQLQRTQLTADNLHFTQFHSFAQHHVQNGFLIVHLYGVVFVTYKTYDQMIGFVGFRYGKSTVLTSGYPTGNVFPENVGAYNRFACLIFHRTAHLRLYGQTAEKQSGQ